MKIPGSKAKLQPCCTAYALERSLGEGGNGIVYSARHAVHGDVAVKFLLNEDSKRYSRFRDEVLVVTTRLKGSTRVVPIIEHHLPSEFTSSNVPWYSMPAAVPLAKHLRELDWTARLTALVSLAEGLAELHDLQVAHRDIKPENLFHLEGTARFGDFGLADFPENAGVTTKTEQMGPWAYLAPEMQSGHLTADPFKADVYSFAKTVWSTLTSQKIPFPGQYSAASGMNLSSFGRGGDRDFVVEPLDRLLERSTAHEPSARPSAATFAQELADVLKIQEDFHRANLIQWEAAELDALRIPGMVSTTWKGTKAIAEVLTLLSRRHGLNHLFFPGGGGLNVERASAVEGGEMLSMGVSESSVVVVKPVQLTLERFPDHPEVNYAVLETSDVAKLGVDSRFVSSDAEVLMQVNDHDYVERDTEREDYPNAHVTTYCERFFKGGLFVIAPTRGLFNLSDDYLGSANTMGKAALRQRFEDFVTSQKSETMRGESIRFERQIRLLRVAPREQPVFALRHLDMHKFEELVRIDDELLAAHRETVKERGLVAKPLSTFLEPSELELRAMGLIGSLSPEQRCEYLALVWLARRDIEPEEFAKYADSKEALQHNDSYLFGKLGNSYMRKAVGKFGLDIVLADS